MLPVLLLLAVGLLLRVSSSAQTETRQARSDVRSMMDKLDPNFWPTRGRRSSSSSSEETPPPFWAHRGRAIDELETVLAERAPSGSEEVAPPFWAHRGREVPCSDQGSMAHPLSAEEPRWVMFNRRDAEEVNPAADDSFWITQGPSGLPPNEFWVSRGKKERSNQKKDALRALIMPQEDFYPTRGKRALPKPNLAT